METTAAAFTITLADIARHAAKLGMLEAGVTLHYRHNGAGHPPYVYATDSSGEAAQHHTRDASEFLPQFTYKFTRRESMAALEACERALSHVARFQAARQD